MRVFFLCLWGGPWSEKRGLMILETSHWDACASMRFLLDLEILKTYLWLLPFFFLDTHQTPPLITGGFSKRLLGRVVHVGRLLAAAVSAAVVQSFLPGGPAIKTTDFSWDGGNVVGFLRSKHGEDRRCGWWWWPGWLGGNYPHEMCFFLFGVKIWKILLQKN